MKKMPKDTKPMKGSSDGMPGVRKGNKPISKGKADNRTARADGGLCSTDWMVSQGKKKS